MKRKLPVVNFKLVSSPIVVATPITPEFRKALRQIIKTWNKNKNKPNKEFRVRSDVQQQIIELTKNFHVFRTLRAKWVPELSQDLEAFYNIKAEPALKRALKRELKKNVKN